MIGMQANFSRRTLLLSGTGLVAGTVAGAALAATSTTSATKSGTPRAELEAITDRYIKALLAHDPALAPFAPSAVFSENDQRLALGEASWRTFERFGRYRHYFADPDNGDAGLIANAYETGSGCVFVLRLKVRDGLITEAEQFVSRDTLGADTYEKLGAPDPVWLEPIPPAQRQSQDALRAVGFMYFEALQRNDGAGIYPFRDDCQRTEHGAQTVGRPPAQGYGHSDAATSYITLKAKQQYEFGLMAFVSRIRDRRTLVADVERGAVLASSYYDYDGALKEIHFRNGQSWTLPPYFRTSRSHHANEAFKIINGSFRYIEMTFLEVPFATRHAFSGPAMTVSLDYDVPQPLPKPIGASHRSELEGLRVRVLDAIVRNCACELPLASNVRYTENGVPVPIGTGLWQSTNGLRANGVDLSDPTSGQAGWLGALDERGLFTMIALRLRVVEGLIHEIEVIVVRPQKPAAGQLLANATFTMFTPPLEHDLDPAAFATAPDAKLLEATPADRATLIRAAQAHEAQLVAHERPVSAAARVRSNGHAVNATDRLPKTVKPRQHRVLLADPDRGLILDCALRDNPTSLHEPAFMTAPWSDLHARLLKVEHGAVSVSEGLVARLPYGQGSGWKSE